MSKFTCDPTKKQDPKTSEELCQSTPTAAPRPSPLKSSSSGSRFKIPSGWRTRRTQSNNDRSPEASKEEAATIGSRRNSSATLSRLVSFLFHQIPEIRRNLCFNRQSSLASKRTTRQAKRVQMSEVLMEAPPTLFNVLEQGPSNARHSQSWLSADGVSPLDVSKPALIGRSRSSYFSTSLPPTHEELPKADGIQSWPVAECMPRSDEDSFSSDDMCCKRRNRTIRGAAAEKAVEFSAGLSRRTTGESEEECGIGGF